MDSVQGKVLAFVGCGKISSCMVKGYASNVANLPAKILVSKRSVDKSQALAASFPDLVEVLDDNAEIVSRSDIVFIGLLPGVARAELPHLPFNNKQLIISMMAAVDFAEVQTLIKLENSDYSNVVRTVPLPSVSRRSGPILMYPKHNSAIYDVLACVGTPVPCENEAQMKPMVSVTGHISSFYELMRTSQQFLQDSGVESDLARTFVTSFYSSLAQGATLSHDTLEEMRDEAATPGGLNEQSVRFLLNTPHFALHNESLEQILLRLQGGVKK